MPPSPQPRSECFYDQLEHVIGYTPMHDQLRAELVVMVRGMMALESLPHPYNMFHHEECYSCTAIRRARELMYRVANRKMMTDGKVQKLIDDPKFKDPMGEVKPT